MTTSDHLSYEPLRWFEPQSPSEKGTIICVHGLNNPPSMFDELSSELSARGFSVLRVGLSGHNGPFSDFQKVNKDSWLNEVKDAFLHAKARHPSHPVYAVGYSLGGALCTLLQNQSDEVNFKRMVLIAPAISLRLWARMLMSASRLLPSKLGMPSATPKEFQRFSRTPVMAYRQLFLIQRATSNMVTRTKLMKTVTKIYVSSHDEFMSTMDLQVWINERSLAEWEIYRLNPMSRTTRGHLIASPQTIGVEAWQKLIREIASLFS